MVRRVVANCWCSSDVHQSNAARQQVHLLLGPCRAVWAQRQLLVIGGLQLLHLQHRNASILSTTCFAKLAPLLSCCKRPTDGSAALH